MKKIFLTLFSITVFLLQSYSQQRIKINYNKEWEITYDSIPYYFRLVIFDSVNNCFSGKVVDFYSDSTVEMTGYYSNCMKNSYFIFYYPNGKIKKKILYNDDHLAGEGEYYFENGQLNQRLLFNNGDFSLIELNDSLGNDLMLSKSVKWDYAFRECYSYDTIEISGKFKNGQKNGVWKWKWKDGQNIITWVYRNGDIISSECLIPPFFIENDPNFNNAIPDDLKLIFTENLKNESSSNSLVIIEDIPQPLSKIKSVISFDIFNENLEIKLKSIRKSIETPMKIDVRYTIDKNGHVEINNITGGNSEVINLISLYLTDSKWRPGIRLGRPVKCQNNGVINITDQKIIVQLNNMSVGNE